MAIINNIKKEPFSLEAEQSLLGSILINPESFNDIGGFITGDEFYLEEHKEIFDAMKKLFKDNKSIDFVTLENNISSLELFSSEQPGNYLRTIAEIVPSANNIKDYANIVKDKYLLRKLIQTTGEITEEAYAESSPAEEIINSAEAKVFDLAQKKDLRDLKPIKDIIVTAFDQINDFANKKEEAAGLSTGYSGLDKVLVGLGKSDFIIVGGRPGMGKTAFALNLAANVAKRTDKAICIFSLEMSNEQLVTRLLSSEALVDGTAIRSGSLSSEDWKKLAAAASSLAETNIFIDDTSSITVTGMKSKLRRVKNLGLIVIDYLGLVGSDKKTENRVQEVSDISRNLKIMAKEFNVPVICCAQLSRDVTGRKDSKVPVLSDLRDSGAIEQDADVVIFLHRNEYYNNETDEPENQSVADIVVAKNRHGGLGKVQLGWNKIYTKFITLDNIVPEA